ncbi:hypothetical protein NL676_005716 [Syzygium grande]|nr:hypothetical protein NL676_005716 [Syzygium grande]
MGGDRAPLRSALLPPSPPFLRSASPSVSTNPSCASASASRSRPSAALGSLSASDQPRRACRPPSLPLPRCVFLSAPDHTVAAAAAAASRSPIGSSDLSSARDELGGLINLGVNFEYPIFNNRRKPLEHPSVVIFAPLNLVNLNFHNQMRPPYIMPPGIMNGYYPFPTQMQSPYIMSPGIMNGFPPFTSQMLGYHNRSHGTISSQGSSNSFQHPGMNELNKGYSG